MNGWIQLHRELMDKAIWHHATDGQFKVLVTLLLSVNYEPKKWLWRGQPFEVQAGQMITSAKSLSDKAKVSEQTVRSALKLFEKLDILTRQSTNQNTLITLTNWEVYQQPNEPANKQNNTPTNRQPTSDPTTIKEIKNKQITNTPLTPQGGVESVQKKYTNGFERCFKAYPNKRKKAYAFKFWQRLNLESQTDVILAAIGQLKATDLWKKDNGQYIPLFSTLLNQEEWRDVVDIPKPLTRSEKVLAAKRMRLPWSNRIYSRDEFEPELVDRGGKKLFKLIETGDTYEVNKFEVVAS